jgi:hypothetical protein
LSPGESDDHHGGQDERIDAEKTGNALRPLRWAIDFLVYACVREVRSNVTNARGI